MSKVTVEIRNPHSIVWNSYNVLVAIILTQYLILKWCGHSESNRGHQLGRLGFYLNYARVLQLLNLRGFLSSSDFKSLGLNAQCTADIEMKEIDPTRKGHEPIEGLKFIIGKAGSYRNLKLAPAPSQIRYPAIAIPPAWSGIQGNHPVDR